MAIANSIEKRICISVKPTSRITNTTPIILNCALKYPPMAYFRFSPTRINLLVMDFGTTFFTHSPRFSLSAIKKYADTKATIVPISTDGIRFATFPATSIVGSPIRPISADAVSSRLFINVAQLFCICSGKRSKSVFPCVPIWFSPRSRS